MARWTTPGPLGRHPLTVEGTRRIIFCIGKNNEHLAPVGPWDASFNDTTHISDSGHIVVDPILTEEQTKIRLCKGARNKLMGILSLFGNLFEPGSKPPIKLIPTFAARSSALAKGT